WPNDRAGRVPPRPIACGARRDDAPRRRALKADGLWPRPGRHARRFGDGAGRPRCRGEGDGRRPAPLQAALARQADRRRRRLGDARGRGRRGPHQASTDAHSGVPRRGGGSGAAPRRRSARGGGGRRDDAAGRRAPHAAPPRARRRRRPGERLAPRPPQAARQRHRGPRVKRAVRKSEQASCGLGHESVGKYKSYCQKAAHGVVLIVCVLSRGVATLSVLVLES
ncbi:hypothetical protein M885DRAFT_622167, partial [Pelagophyceae sp. CCMP2097]